MEGEVGSYSISQQLNTHLTVLSAANFTNDFVFLLISPIDCQRLIIPVIPRPMNVDVRVDTGEGNKGESSPFICCTIKGFSPIILQRTVLDS